MIRLWKNHRLLVSAFVLALAVFGFFAVKFVVHVVYWSNPDHHNQQIEAWMTVGYIGKSWHLDPRQIDDLAGTPKPQGRPKPLIDIARDQGVPVAEVISRVQAAIAQLSAAPHE
jgi:hypothetical protein